jgi:hypothetical protein
MIKRGGVNHRISQIKKDQGRSEKSLFAPGEVKMVGCLDRPTKKPKKEEMSE